MKMNGNPSRYIDWPSEVGVEFKADWTMPWVSSLLHLYLDKKFVVGCRDMPYLNTIAYSQDEVVGLLLV